MRLRKGKLVVAVAATGSFIVCNVPLPIKNERVVRARNLPVSSEYRNISENIARKVVAFRLQKRKKEQHELLLRKNCSMVIASSLNKIIKKVNQSN